MQFRRRRTRLHAVDGSNATAVLLPQALDDLIDALVGPTVRDGAIVYDELEDASQLPAGWTDR
jgi:hypothetical protein